MAKYRTNELKHTISVLKALGETNRLRVVAVLVDRELCVCQIVKLLSLAPSTVSRHLYVLRQAGLIDLKKKGRWIYYSLADKSQSESIQNLLRLLLAAVSTDEQIIADEKKLRKILQQDPEKLCLELRIR